MFGLQQALELLVLDLAIPGVVDLLDQLLDVDGQLELLLYDCDQDVGVDVPALVLRPPDGHICIQSVLVVIPQHIQGPLLPVQFQDVREPDEPRVLVVQLRNQLGQLDLAQLDVQLVQSSIEVIHRDVPVVVVVQVLY